MTSSVSSLRETWSQRARADRAAAFEALSRADAEQLMLGLSAAEQADLLLGLPLPERRLWMRALPPDDAADCLQATGPEGRDALLQLLDEGARREMNALLAYAEDDAGGLMSPRFARLRPEIRIDEALSYLRRQALERVETLYYAYVLDADQRLLGVASVRELFAAPSDTTVAAVMRMTLVTVREDTDQEDLVGFDGRMTALAIGLVRIVLWQSFFGAYGADYLNVAVTVGTSLVAVVVWGAVMGAMLPFVLRAVTADPATASTPLVATIVDVSGIVIYFATARVFLLPA